MLGTEAIEYRVRCWRRRQLSRCGVVLETEAGRAAGGRADRDFNRTPKDSLLQRGAVE